MKKHITREDISQLTQDQRQHLRELWLPEKYDLSVAYICKNAETEEYEEIEFVVGNVILSNTRIILNDLKAMNDNESGDAGSDSGLSDDSTAKDQEYISDNDEVTFEEVDETLEEDDEANYDFESFFLRPTTFLKEDCLPLLSIGQMIEILSRSNNKSIDFYLLADNGETACELGSKEYKLSGYESDFESKEFCDVLWDCVKKIL